MVSGMSGEEVQC